MKKSVFLVLFFVLFTTLFVGCEMKESYTVVITNKSSKTVTYDYFDASTTLVPKESKTYEIKETVDPPKNVVDENGIASIKTTRNLDNITFTDATAYDLDVLNTLPFAVRIKSDKYIDNSGKTNLTIEAGSNATAKIYTLTPQFTSSNDYSVVIDVNVNKNTVYVIIK